jgi:hypothetical protein
MKQIWDFFEFFIVPIILLYSLGMSFYIFYVLIAEWVFLCFEGEQGHKCSIIKIVPPKLI